MKSPLVDCTTAEWGGTCHVHPNPTSHLPSSFLHGFLWLLRGALFCTLSTGSEFETHTYVSGAFVHSSSGAKRSACISFDGVATEGGSSHFLAFPVRTDTISPLTNPLHISLEVYVVVIVPGILTPVEFPMCMNYFRAPQEVRPSHPFACRRRHLLPRYWYSMK